MNLKNRVAIMYDFDETLAPGNMQEYGFIPNLNIDADEFWKEAGIIAKSHNMDSILAYMYVMVRMAKDSNLKITREELVKQGKLISCFKGVETWFKRINDYARSLGLVVEHYIISCGLKEILEGTSIAKEFTRLYGCSFTYGQDGSPIWPNNVINYTSKTQFIYRVRKRQLDNLYDSYALNEYVEDRDTLLPHSNMIYVGDGETDVPCMKIVKNAGGHSICVYNPDKIRKKTIADKIYKSGRVSYIAPADYSEGEKMESIVKAILEKIALENKLSTFEK